MKQSVRVFQDDDPFNDQLLELEVKKGEKILSTSPNTKELYEMYSDYFSENDFSNQKNIMDGDYNANATVSRISKDVAYLDTDSKETLLLNLKKEESRYLEDIKVGNQLTVYVKPRVGNNSLEASYSTWIKNNKIKDIVSNINNTSIAYEATVKKLIHGGYYLDLDGIEVFMPGSLGGINKLYDFEQLLGEKIIVMPVNYSSDKNTIVVSHRKYLRTLIPAAIENLKENIDSSYTGHVTGTVKNGVFVEFNDCLTGLVNENDLDPNTVKRFRNREIKPGDNIDFKVKQIISNKKIILTQKESLSEAWNRLEEELRPLSITEGKVTKITKYGAFIEIRKGVSGLIYDTNISDYDLTEGSTAKVRIDKIDIENKKINLTLVT
jgi:ribosomal protein S1